MLPGDDVQGATQTNPAGSRFNITGETHIEYLGWAFDWSITPITGVTLWDIRFQGERIVYEMGTQEVYVPYSGRSPAQSNSLYFDTAWGFGASSFPMKAGVDCPEGAGFLDVTQYFETGDVVVHKNAICVFEKDATIPVRRHYEMLRDSYAGTPSRALVFRHAVTDYNYDYILDYEFYPTGAIEAHVAASGYLQGTLYSEEEAQYGSPRVGPYQSGTFHQHLFLYKVDIDVLGTDNTLRVTRFPSVEINAPWFDGATKVRPVPEHYYVANETESTFFPDFNDPMVFAFTNDHQTNGYGAERAYRIHSTSFVKHLFPGALGDAASWANYHLAVVQRKEEEPTPNNVYAQARPYDRALGLSRSLDRWLEDEDSLEQEDLVAYINLGVNHLPHTEDVPVTVTPTSHVSFVLQPINYFDRDPASALRDGVRAFVTESGILAEDESDPLRLVPGEACVVEAEEVPQVAPYASGTRGPGA